MARRSAALERRVFESSLLYQARCFEGAMLSAIVAVAGASRIRFPEGTKSVIDPKKKMGDREAFVCWLDAEWERRGFPHRVGWQGKSHNVNDVLYKSLRCHLTHVASLPIEIILDPPRGHTTAGFKACKNNPSRLHVHSGTILLLNDFVASAPEIQPFSPEVRKGIRNLMIPKPNGVGGAVGVG